MTREEKIEQFGRRIVDIIYRDDALLEDMFEFVSDLLGDQPTPDAEDETVWEDWMGLHFYPAATEVMFKAIAIAMTLIRYFPEDPMDDEPPYIKWRRVGSS
jgi:hypothetical protein